ncbi:hypothetical protein CUR178_07418 [Leishmania enriettii]|uniref:Uncharacterized protein n=1 Tax=Leishmania enriettii TaxID=5663 RepID=A0A836HDQ7_LEIEN|nr:hypothetical protein CUR178_07418 [Leishmania enriettii]
MYRSSVLRRHPYTIDISSLREANGRNEVPRKVGLTQIAIQSARQAWCKTQDLFAFLFPQGYRGGPAK